MMSLSAGMTHSVATVVDSPVIPKSIRYNTSIFSYNTRFMSSLPQYSVLGMPALSPTMTIGNIGAWKKSEKEFVEPGDVIADIETDKATMEWEAVDEGFIAKILMPSGSQNVAVNDPVLIMVEDSADIDAFKEFTIDSLGSNSGAVEAKAVDDKVEIPSSSSPEPLKTSPLPTSESLQTSVPTQKPSQEVDRRNARSGIPSLVYYTKDDAFSISRTDNWIPGRR